VPEVVDSKAVNLGSTPELCGLYSSSHAAKAKLKELAQQHMLCLALLGLEKTSTRGCFGLQIKTCLGACVGREDRSIHDQRLFSALVDSQVEVWPFDGPIDLIEEAGEWVQRHRVNNWCYLGTQCSRSGNASQINAYKQNDFDLDSYKILVKPIMLKTVKVEEVEP
jgi:excinuclease Cho